MAAIAASIREWGWTTPALVGEDGGLIAGHARVLAARQLGIAEIPVMVAAGWTEAQKRAYVLADGCRFRRARGVLEYGNPSRWKEAAREIGLKMNDARKIVSAADGRGRLRRRLLAACGLTLERSSDRKGRGN